MSSWVPALITSSISLVVAIGVSFLNARSQRQLRWLDSRLAEQSAEDAAKRAYQYDARKRLYGEVNPQLFQLREACDMSSRRLRRIINGDIVIVPPRHVMSSAERLFAPLVYAQELQRHLTSVDLSLDDAIRAQYAVSKELLWTFHEGMIIAAARPAISYRSPAGPKEPRQHLTVAQLQRLVDVLTVKEDNGSRRPMRQNELDDKLSDEELMKAVKPIGELFAGADPNTHPVLWRLLLAQAMLMQVFIEIFDSGASHIDGSMTLPSIDAYKNALESPEHFNGQVDAARRYVEERLLGLRVKNSSVD